MNIILQDMLELQALEFGETTGKKVEERVAQLRGKIPQPFIGHYDRLRARDKKGVAAVRHQSCTGCHMHVPIGQITVLMREEDIQLCETCGRYLYLPAPEEEELPKPTETPKPAPKAAAKPRKRKALVPAL